MGWRAAIAVSESVAITRWSILDRRQHIAIILLVLWVLGLVSSYTVGGFIHILLVLAVVVILIRIIQGRRL